jgi:hypothetical protein
MRTICPTSTAIDALTEAVRSGLPAAQEEVPA